MCTDAAEQCWVFNKNNCKCTVECAGKRILKIDQYLMKL